MDNVFAIVLILVLGSWLWLPFVMALVAVFFRGVTDVVLAFRGQRSEKEGDRG